jgi:hypothetical protein
MSIWYRLSLPLRHLRDGDALREVLMDALDQGVIPRIIHVRIFRQRSHHRTERLHESAVTRGRVQVCDLEGTDERPPTREAGGDHFV